MSNPPDNNDTEISPLFGYKSAKSDNLDISAFDEDIGYTQEESPVPSITPEQARELLLEERTGRPGKPTKLTSARANLIVSKIREGVPQKVAAGLAGISPGTFDGWYRQGVADLNEEVESNYSRFALAVFIAKSELEAKLAAKWVKITTEPTTKRKQVFTEKLITKEDGSTEIVRYLESDTIEITGDGNWQGIAEYMSRRYPERWKRQQTIEQTGPDGGPIQIQQVTIDVDNLTSEARELLLREIKQVGTGGTEAARAESIQGEVEQGKERREE